MGVEWGDSDGVVMWWDSWVVGFERRRGAAALFLNKLKKAYAVSLSFSLVRLERPLFTKTRSIPFPDYVTC